MKLPAMRYADGIRKETQTVFGGLEHREGGADGTIWEMKNLTGDQYPLLSPRGSRYLERVLSAPGGICAADALAWVDGTTLWYDGAEAMTVTAGRKKLCVCGTWILIFPDRVWYDTQTGEHGDMAPAWEGSAITIRDGTIYGEAAKGNTIYAEGVDWEEYFRVGDGVAITGCVTHPENNKTAIIREIDGEEMRFSDNCFETGEGTEYTEEGSIGIRRDVPELDGCFVNENRAWGWHGDTIYASKLGDFLNWSVYDGLETDSWAVDTGTKGSFTAGISYGGYPVFFKEDRIFKVYGNLPSTFEVMGSATLGVLAGSGESLAIAGERLYYLSGSGFMEYSGGKPAPVGIELGERYSGGVAASDGLRYHVCARRENGEETNLVYDTVRGMWHREDDTEVIGLTECRRNVWMLTADGRILSKRKDSDDQTEEDEVRWECEFADFTAGDAYSKSLGKILIRLELERGSEAEIWVRQDSREWMKAAELERAEKRSIAVPLIPRRADHYRVKIVGKGPCLIYAVTREYSVGSGMKTRKGSVRE